SSAPEGADDVADGERESWAGTEPAPEFPAGQSWFNVERPLSMVDLRGKVVILDFWTLGCINCQHIIPDLKRLEAEFGDALAVVGVHSGKYDREHDDESIRDAIGKYGLEHAVVNDPDFAIWSLYGARAWPTLVIIDPAGNLVGGHAGEGIYPLFQPIVASLVTEFDDRGLISREALPIDIEAEVTTSTVLAYPADVAVDVAGGRLYIADSGHNRVLVATLDGALVEAIGGGEEGFADGTFSEARFRQPQGLALSPGGDLLYVADTRNHAVRVVDLAAGSVRTLAGTGQQLDRLPADGTAARDAALASPWDCVVVGEQLFVSMAGVHQVWVVDLESETIGVFAGTSREGIDDGQRLTMATLAQPSGIDSDGETLFWVDPESSSVRRVPIEGDGEVETLVGQGLFEFGDEDGAGAAARLEHPQGLAVAGGVLYVADTYNHKVKLIDPATATSTTFAGLREPGWADGLGAAVRFNEPGGLAVAGRVAYLADTNNHLIRMVDLDTGEVTTVRLTNLAVAGGGQSGDTLTVELEGTEAAPGGSTLRLVVAAPDGYKLNSLGPSELALSSSDPAVASIGEESVSWASDEQRVEFPIPMVLAAGEAELKAEGAIYFCRAGEESLCFIERVSVRLRLSVAADSSAGEVRMEFALPEEGGD
ncbi:MAG: thioredoxin-like domain-containing protein, partial [Dehalococcoidia bacterium]